MSTTVTRFHRCLVDAIHRSRPDVAGRRPVAVAEIYQSLVPYRSVREALGVDVNAEYEHALLRLLAGEGDLVRLEPSAARDELRRELRSPNPNVGLFRKFAACDVTVKMDSADASADQAVNVPEPPPAPAQSAPPADQARVGVRASTGPHAAPQASCAFCHVRLPEGRSVRYCPSCGQDQRCRPCRSCGEVLETDWRFCIACGAAADAGETGSQPG